VSEKRSVLQSVSN